MAGPQPTQTWYRMRPNCLSLAGVTALILGLAPATASAQQRIRIEDVPGIRSRAPQTRIEVRERPTRAREMQIERTWEMRERLDRISMREAERAREINMRLLEQRIERAEAARERSRELRERMREMEARAKERARARGADECEASARHRLAARRTRS